MQSQNFSLSIVIPVYNEASNIVALYQEIADLLSNLEYRYEVIFVDDGSDDDTKLFLKQLALQYTEVKVITHQHNYGQSAALVSGVSHAQYPWVITLDGDGQNDPHDIPLLMATLKEQADRLVMVVGTRTKRQDTWLRKISSKIGNGVRRFILKDDCPDTGCSLKLFPTAGFLAIPHFDHVHRFLPALFKRAGYRVVNVPVNHRLRRSGVSKYGVRNRLWVGIIDLIGVWWLVHRPCNPETNNDNKY